MAIESQMSSVKSPQQKPTRKLSIAMNGVTQDMRLRSSQMQLLSRAPAQPELSQGYSRQFLEPWCDISFGCLYLS